jgi:hypothetical protein
MVWQHEAQHYEFSTSRDAAPVAPLVAAVVLLVASLLCLLTDLRWPGVPILLLLILGVGAATLAGVGGGYRIVCTPEALTVGIERAAAARRQVLGEWLELVGRPLAAGGERYAYTTYPWGEVVATDYREREAQDLDGTVTLTRSFAVLTPRGVAVEARGELAGFDTLIAVVNACTPHLPYEWREVRPGRFQRVDRA